MILTLIVFCFGFDHRVAGLSAGMPRVDSVFSPKVHDVTAYMYRVRVPFPCNPERLSRNLVVCLT
jgi:hypothetical protein